MNIYYYKHPGGNVGDDLNPWLWPKLLPDTFSGFRGHGGPPDESDTTPIFVGIGTLLNEQLPKNCKKAVFGTGAGYGAARRDANTKYYAVRGPLTAERFQLDPKTAVTDGAALISTLVHPASSRVHRVSLIPHHGSVENSQRWAGIARQLGINFINPAQHPEVVIEAIASSELVIAEAMHGAILADSLRVPWIPYMTTSGVHDFKWHDWCGGLNLTYQPERLYPLYDVQKIKNRFTNQIKQQLNLAALKAIIRRKQPMLSDDLLFKAKVALLQDRLDEFKQDLTAGHFGPSLDKRTPLKPLMAVQP